MELVRHKGNVSDTHSGGTWFESWPRTSYPNRFVMAFLCSPI